MSGSLKMFEVCVKNTLSRETVTFLGQGKTVADALSDGIKNVQATFRPRDGVTRKESHVAVTLPDGRPTLRTLNEFESDDGPKAAESVEMEFA